MKTLKLNSLFILLFISILNLFFSLKATAQGPMWEQLGPGGGGQIRTVYIHEYLDGIITKYDVYIGSDVAGVWVIKGLTNISDLTDYESKRYNYISNHRIMRFTNRFYKPGFADHYLYVTNN